MSDFHDEMDKAADYVVEGVKSRIASAPVDIDDEQFEGVFDIAMSNEGDEAMIPFGKEVCRRLGKEYPW